MRRFRFGLLIGFALGYWFGTKAGRERHRQLTELLHRAKESEAVAVAADKAKDLVETGVEKGRGLVEHVRSDDADADAGDTTSTGSDPDEPTGTVVTDTGPVTGNGHNGDGSADPGKPAIGTPVGRNESVNPGLPNPEI